MDERRIGRIARSLRHRLSLTQTELARRSACSQATVSLLERGRLESVSLPVARRIMRSLDAELLLVARWRGGDIDRLLDARHAELGEAAARRLLAAGWEVMPEVSFSIYGERGSIDLLGWHDGTRTLLVVELKSEITSIEETLRRHDAKVRLAGRIAAERFGWRPTEIARLLVLPDHRTARRRVEEHAALFERAYPVRTVGVRRWLREPAPGNLSGILFLSDSDHPRGMRVGAPRRRVRAAQGSGATLGASLDAAVVVAAEAETRDEHAPHR